ncbi:MAG: cytochrome o ubiquinol oxidase subunit III, partial [Pseudomonadota bacterium]|nr:cytochrome o ubiquinol oxidase subunit III [Pseudomonadota bacterium]
MSTIATSSAASMPHEHAHEEHHENNTVFGFWLYLMTDCLLFASFFATYAVLFMNTA